jgi:hypothetical protein
MNISNEKMDNYSLDREILQEKIKDLTEWVNFCNKKVEENKEIDMDDYWSKQKLTAIGLLSFFTKNFVRRI